MSQFPDDGLILSFSFSTFGGEASPDFSPALYYEAGSDWVIATFRTLTTEQYDNAATSAQNPKLTMPQPATSSRNEIL